MKEPEKRHKRILEQQEALPPERTGNVPKAERMDDERDDEQKEGITAARRGSPAAPSDRPENEPPHPQDVNEIGDARG